MALADIITTIGLKSQDESAQIIASAEKAVRINSEEAEKKGAEYSASRFAEYEEKKTMLEKKYASENFREENILLSDIRTQGIDDIYNSALDSVAERTDDKIIDFLSNALSSIPSSKGEILSKGTSSEVLTSALEKSGKEFTLSSQMSEGKGGFVFKGSEYEMDFSFDTIFRTMLREKTEADILKNFA